MKTYTQEQLKDILAKHARWRAGAEGGERADLSGADLSYASLRGAILRDAKLCEARLCYTDLRGAILRGAILRGADLCNANMSYADLRTAILSDADLCNANMSSADLSEADMREVNMSYANLRGANLRGAILRGAEMGYNAYFASTLGQPIYQCSCGFSSRNATLTLYAKGEPSEWLFFTGCFTGTEAELRAAVAEEHGNTPLGHRYNLAIDYLLAIANSNRVAEHESTNTKGPLAQAAERPLDGRGEADASSARSHPADEKTAGAPKGAVS